MVAFLLKAHCVTFNVQLDTENTISAVDSDEGLTHLNPTFVCLTRGELLTAKLHNSLLIL